MNNLSRAFIALSAMSLLLCMPCLATAKSVTGTASVIIMNSAPIVSSSRGERVVVGGKVTFVPTRVEVVGKNIKTITPTVITLSGVSPNTVSFAKVTAKSPVFYASEREMPTEKRSNLGFAEQTIDHLDNTLNITTDNTGSVEMKIYTSGEMNETPDPKSADSLMAQYEVSIDF